MSNSFASVRIDIGSSTVKVVHQQGERVHTMQTESVHFKDHYQVGKGLSSKAIRRLVRIIRQARREQPQAACYLYATAFFRQMSTVEQRVVVDEVFRLTGLPIAIISSELEGFYLEKALSGRCLISKPVLLINIGGGSTELVVVRNQKVLERALLDVGVGQLLAEFPQVNESYSAYPLTDLVGSLRKFLPKLKTQPVVGIYSGGELTFMRRMDYPLIPNTAFADSNHPVMLRSEDFITSNKLLFNEYSLADLQGKMPENPKWMLGARLCSALAQAIVEQYGLQLLVPSDANLVDGIIQQEWRTVAISGSFRKHLNEIIVLKKTIEKMGAKVLSPRFTRARNPGAEFVTFAGEEQASPLELERNHLAAIEQADALIVCNPEGYVGASALIEIGYAQSLGKRIVFTESPTEFMLQTLPAEVGLPWAD